MQTPKYRSPYYRDSQEGTHNFGIAPHPPAVQEKHQQAAAQMRLNQFSGLRGVCASAVRFLRLQEHGLDCSQNYGPLLVTSDMTAPNIYPTKRGTLIFGNYTHVELRRARRVRRGFTDTSWSVVKNWREIA